MFHQRRSETRLINNMLDRERSTLEFFHVKQSTRGNDPQTLKLNFIQQNASTFPNGSTDAYFGVAKSFLSTSSFSAYTTSDGPSR